MAEVSIDSVRVKVRCADDLDESVLLAGLRLGYAVREYVPNRRQILITSGWPRAGRRHPPGTYTYAEGTSSPATLRR